MNIKDYVGWMMTGVQTVLTVIQTNPKLQQIAFYITLATAIINLLYSIRRWYKSAIADKRISNAENQNLLTILMTHLESIASILKGEPKMSIPCEKEENNVKIEEEKEVQKPNEIITTNESDNRFID